MRCGAAYSEESQHWAGTYDLLERCLTPALGRIGPKLPLVAISDAALQPVNADIDASGSVSGNLEISFSLCKIESINNFHI